MSGTLQSFEAAPGVSVKDQCKATWSTKDGRTLEYGCHTFCCVRKSGHDTVERALPMEYNGHFDHYGRWDGKNVVSLERAQQEMNIRP